MASKYIPPAVVQDISIPTSYSDLGFTQIRVTNVPESSKEVTPVQLVTLYRPQKVNAFTPTVRKVDVKRTSKTSANLALDFH